MNVYNVPDPVGKNPKKKTRILSSRTSVYLISDLSGVGITDTKDEEEPAM